MTNLQNITRSSAVAEKRCDSVDQLNFCQLRHNATVHSKYRLSQMDPRDVLPSVHHVVNTSGWSLTADRRKDSQLMLTVHYFEFLSI